LRIERIEVRRFGCLRELLIEHPGPMTLIFGENGSGKSTLMTFIYSILYGLGPAGRSAETNTRLHYMPWGENEMGGSLDIRHGDHTLRIERGFGGKKSEDWCRVWILETGERLFLRNPDQPGREILDIAPQVFLNTVFIPSGKTRPNMDRDRKGEIESALLGEVAISATDSQTITVRQVLDLLRGQAAELRSPSGTKGLLPEIEKKIAELELNWSQVLEAERRIALIQRELQETMERQAEARRSMIALEQRLEGAQLIRRLSEIRLSLSDLLDQHPRGSPALNDPAPMGDSFPYGRLSVGLLFVMLGVLGGYFIHPGIYALSGLGLALLIGAFGGRFKRRNLAVEPSNTNGRGDRLEDSYDDLLEQIRVWREQSGISPDDPDLSPAHYHRLCEQADARRRQADKLRGRVDYLSGQLEALRTGEVDAAQLEAQVARERRRRQALLERYDYLEQTMDRVRQAADEFRENTNPRLIARLRHWLPIFTGGTVIDGRVDADLLLRVTLDQPGTPSFVEEGHLSAGTAQQAHLALRMALIESLSAAQPLPLLLDAPFGGWDDKRLTLTLEALLNFAENTERQLLIFSESARLANWCSGQTSSIEVIIL
jgi:uncharacterized protein YhaN